jgi:hypothetical protein
MVQQLRKAALDYVRALEKKGGEQKKLRRI